MTHDAWRDVIAPYIAAYKAGASSPTVTVRLFIYSHPTCTLTPILFWQTEELVYYYRPNPKDAPCSDSVAQPTGYDYDDDSVFVIAMTSAAATVVIQSGSNAAISIDVPAGITTVSAPMSTGSQVFTLTRSGGTVMTGTGGLDVSFTCTVYNFNAYVGSVTAS